MLFGKFAERSCSDWSNLLLDKPVYEMFTGKLASLIFSSLVSIITEFFFYFMQNSVQHHCLNLINSNNSFVDRSSGSRSVDTDDFTDRGAWSIWDHTTEREILALKGNFQGRILCID